MSWSRLKSKIEDRIAEPLRRRVSIHITSYRDAGWLEGRGWLLVDKTEIPLASTQPFGEPRIPGQHDRPSIHDVLVGYLDLTVAAALQAKEPIHRALAMIDRRLGRRRFEALQLTNDEHPVVRQLYELRGEAERWRVLSPGGLTRA
jgi:hypothetical protein